MFLKTLVFFILVQFLASCSLLSDCNDSTMPAEIFISSDEVDLEDQQRTFFREELKNANTKLKQNIKKMLKEELLPEIWSSDKNKTIRDDQKRVLKTAKEKLFLGRIEWVYFQEPDLSLQARIDSGAKTCSLHAKDIKEMKVNGEDFVQFETEDDSGNIHTMVQRVISRTKVKDTSGNSTLRYVIRSAIKMGDKMHHININLNDRSNLRYKFLLGRNLLLGNYLVDVSESHLLGETQ